MFNLLVAFWFIWELKYILFWLYLWQLKEYHIGRFGDHFRTHKGKKLIFSINQILKLVLLFGLFLLDSYAKEIIFVLFLFYFVESVLFFRALIRKTFKRPVLTFKMWILIVACIVALSIAFIVSVNVGYIVQARFILLFDILTPIIISIIVLLAQPFFALARNIILSKAKIKLENIKKLSNLTVIVITGSYGKTSTKEFLATILSKKYKVLSTKEHQNSEIGVASCILKYLNPSHEIFIAEVGAYNKGKVKEVCSILKPKIGIVTGVNEQHLSLFGSMENLLSAEGGGELSEFLIDNGTLIVNGDNKYCLNLYKKFNPSTGLGQAKVYSQNNKVVDSDIWSEEMTVHKDYISFVAINKQKETALFNVKVLGGQNIQNLLGAILTAKHLGMNLGEISEVCKNIKPEQAGMVLKNGEHGINIIDSSYSSNPDGVFADLDYLSIFSKKKVIVMPCLIELGKKSSQIHEKIGKKIGEVCDLAIITSKDKFKEIKEGAIKAGIKEKNVIFSDNPKDIHAIVTLFCKADDAVLLEGRVPKQLINLLTK